MAFDPVFREGAIIDVTYYDVTDPEEPLGYLCGGAVSVLPDGAVIIQNESEELERFFVRDIIHLHTNINSFDPEHLTEVAISLEDRDIRLTFTDAKSKRDFVKALG